MTILVGLLCKEGVIIGSDSSVTFNAGGMNTIEQTGRKIDIINENLILTGTGSVGLGQRFKYIIEQVFKDPSISTKNENEIACHLTAQALGNLRSTGAAIQYGALLAFFSNNKFNLCEFECNTLQPEFKTGNLWYVSMGSGQPIADPFLGFIRRVFWGDQQPSLRDGIFAAYWTLFHTCKINPGGINEPITIAQLYMDNGNVKAMILENNVIEEHRGNVLELENYIGLYKKDIQEDNTISEIPKLEG